ncbi:MAG: hypothetical protein P8N56_05025 [Schleiferiaceae bacterium]|nr:hypothetical protein [Schleiferiaceae bacterium]
MYLTRRTLLLSIGYILVSLLLVNLGNEGGANTVSENLLGRGWETSLWYYGAQLVLLAYYLFLVRLGWVNTIIVVALLALLRTFSSGIAILTIAIVLGRDFVNNQVKKPEN